jgi:hypothetical protein
MKNNVLSPEERAELERCENTIQSVIDGHRKAIKAIIGLGEILEPYVKSYDENHRDLSKSKREVDFDQWARIRFKRTGKQARVCVKAYRKRMSYLYAHPLSEKVSNLLDEFIENELGGKE